MNGLTIEQKEDNTSSCNYRVLAISGSLRSASLNTKLLRAAIDLAPLDMTIELYEQLRELPHYDPDQDGDDRAQAVTNLRNRIKLADGLLISTPEYNYGIPGSLKNLIDWASRPSIGSVIWHKPIAIIGVTSGNFGTVRAQMNLRQILLWTDSDLVSRPELLVFRGNDRFSINGKLTDVSTADLLRGVLEALRKRIGINRVEFQGDV